MCHCQRRLASEHLHNSCNIHDFLHQGSPTIISSWCFMGNFSFRLTQGSCSTHLVSFWSSQPHRMKFVNMLSCHGDGLVIFTWPKDDILVISDARDHPWTETPVAAYVPAPLPLRKTVCHQSAVNPGIGWARRDPPVERMLPPEHPYSVLPYRDHLYHMNSWVKW